MTQETIVSFLLEHSPPGSGPIYRFLAENWDIVSGGLTALFGLLFVLAVGFAAAYYLEVSE